MAAPRCARTILGSARRAQVAAPAPRVTYPVYTVSRAQSSRSNDGEDEKDSKGEIDSFSYGMGLDERLEKMGVDPAEYKMLWRSQQKYLKEQEQSKQPRKMWEKYKIRADLRNTPDHYSLLSMFKGQGVEPIKLAKERGIELPGGEKPELSDAIKAELDALRKPLNVQAMNLRPMRRSPDHGVPVCDLQLRTYSVRNLLLFADFAMRAAYYLGLPARGPIPLPRITERWTVPRANFVFKKSQENFERITMRRLIQIQDGHPDVVKAWLAFLTKHQYWGIGMKANIWEYESLDEALNVGVKVEEGDYSQRREGPMLDKVREILERPGYKEAMKGYKTPQSAELRP